MLSEAVADAISRIIGITVDSDLPSSLENGEVEFDVGNDFVVLVYVI